MRFTIVSVLALNFCLVSGGFFFNDGPDKVEQNVRVYFSPDSVRLVEFPLSKLPDLIFDKAFNASRPTVMYFHGWTISVKDASVLAMRSAYVGYNIVMVDWSAYSTDQRYLSKVIPQLRIIAETFAQLLQQFLENGYDIERLHLTGHSLGAQTVGKVSRHLTKISRGRFVIPLIIALDPAGPGFEQKLYEGFQPVSRTDARVVQVIHSSTVLGMQTQAGTIDFYPNGGVRQPGCGAILLLSDNNSCNHARAWQFYQAALRNPEGFPAVRCASYDDFLRIDKGGDCDRNNIVYMGLNANRNGTGKFYMQTNGNMFKFSKGMSGISPSKIWLRRLKVKKNENESEENLIINKN